MSDYESSYARWNDAVQKFDYYVVGVIGAGLVVLLRDLKIDRFEWSSNTVKAAGVGFLLVSFLAGLVRLERQHMLLRFENEKIKLSGYRERLKTGTTNVIKESSYQKMTAAEIDALASQVDANFSAVQEALRRTGNRMALAYSVRNWTLLVGLIVLFSAVFVDPIAQSKKKPNQAPEPTATAVTPPAAQEPRQP
jgi:hypothetical protein